MSIKPGVIFEQNGQRYLASHRDNDAMMAINLSTQQMERVVIANAEPPAPPVVEPPAEPHKFAGENAYQPGLLPGTKTQVTPLGIADQQYALFNLDDYEARKAPAKQQSSKLL